MAVGYEVTDVHQRERFTAGGGKVTYVEVTVITEEGATGTLRMKAKDYRKDDLAQQLQVYVDELNRAFAL